MTKFKTFVLIASAIAAIISFTNFSPAGESSEIIVKVYIKYDTLRMERDTIIKTHTGITALEALQYVAKVETHPLDNHVFVTSIDNVKGQRGVTAWYYEVNNKPAKVLAINNILNNGDVVTWIYRKDVCSASIDKNKKTGQTCK